MKGPLLKKLSAFPWKSSVYSLISLLNIACGLSVTALVWYLYSATQESDILLLATSSISIIAQLSLVGVEQVLYFYADHRKVGHETSERFLRLAFTWSLISGLVFAGIFILISKYFVLMVAPGFSEPSRDLTRYLLLCLSPQLITSPALHVLRAKWALEGKFGRAYLLSAVNSFVLLVCLVTTIAVRASRLEVFGELSLAVFLLFLIGFLVYHRKLLVKPLPHEWAQIKSLVIHSSSMKGANSVHNFLVQALISNVLSGMPTGSLSIFQYAKKLADGVFAITAGPQVLIYHSRCATAIAHWNLSEMRRNVFDFLKTFLSLFAAMALIVYVFTPLALAIVGKGLDPSVVSEIRWVYLGIVLWYLIMGIETLSVGVLLATHSSRNLFAVNFVFIFLFFGWTRLHNIEGVLELIFTTAGFQMVSFCLFTLSAFKIIKSRGANAR